MPRKRRSILPGRSSKKLYERKKLRQEERLRSRSIQASTSYDNSPTFSISRGETQHVGTTLTSLSFESQSDVKEKQRESHLSFFCFFIQQMKSDESRFPKKARRRNNTTWTSSTKIDEYTLLSHKLHWTVENNVIQRLFSQI